MSVSHGCAIIIASQTIMNDCILTSNKELSSYQVINHCNLQLWTQLILCSHNAIRTLRRFIGVKKAAGAGSETETGDGSGSGSGTIGTTHPISYSSQPSHFSEVSIIMICNDDFDDDTCRISSTCPDCMDRNCECFVRLNRSKFSLSIDFGL